MKGLYSKLYSKRLLEVEGVFKYWNWSDYYKAKEDVEEGNIDAINAIEVVGDDELEIIAKALISGALLDMSQFKGWRRRAVELEMKQRGF